MGRRLGGRAWTWIWYIPSMAAAVLFCIIALVTFGDLLQIQYDYNAGSPGSQLNGVLAATFIGSITTVGLILMSFFLLVKKSFSQSGADFSYGFCTAWFLLGSQLLLVTGVELTANKHHTSTWEAGAWWVWSRSATNAYVATYVLAFICTVLFFCMGVAMISNRKSFGGQRLTVDELGLSDRLRAAGSPSSSAVPMAASPAPPHNGQATEMSASQSMPGTRTGAWTTAV
ncbi:hypothetical protein ABPG77_004224 [Micractinium sp. CCAP 211/92]